MADLKSNSYKCDNDDAESSGAEAGMESKSKPDLDTALSQAPPPDGGLKAWTHAGLLTIVLFNTWGVSNSFGIFQQYYSHELLAGNSPSAISWIGSVQTACIFGLGVASGRASDAGYFRHMFFTGVFLQIFAVMMTSLGKTYWQIFLSQAICHGLGNGLAFVPALSTTSTYFSKKRGLAVGLGATGAAIGGVVYPALVQNLIAPDKLGFSWTMRCMGFLMLATYVPCLVLYSPRIPPRRTGPIIDTTAFREPTFMFFTASFFFNFWGVYTAFFYISTFARDRIGLANPGNLVMILNGAGIAGRIVPGLIADRYTGLFNLIVPFTFAGSLIVFLWSQVRTASGLYAFVVVNGIVAHAMQSLYPTTATTLTPDLNKTGTRTGMITSAVSIAVLTGPAISGALIQRGASGGDYLYAQVFSGTSILVSAVCITCARVAKAGCKVRVKV